MGIGCLQQVGSIPRLRPLHSFATLEWLEENSPLVDIALLSYPRKMRIIVYHRFLAHILRFTSLYILEPILKNIFTMTMYAELDETC